MPSDIRVSAALIVRDEEKFLEGCLASIVDHVDEIVVVDTGSSDSTIEIARSFPVRLLERRWRDDFAWARNEALAAATGSWILYIDADERMAVPVGTTLSEGLGGRDVFASRVLFRPTVHATPYREYRLFRNDPRLRFRGSMHETMLPDLDHLRAEHGVRVTESPVEILHLGYEGDQLAKHRRNLPLLRAAIAENPDRLYYWHHLAETLGGLGETAEALEIGAEGLRRARQLGVGHADGAIAALMVLTHARRLIDRGAEALPIIEEGFAFYPRNPSLELLKARVLVDRGELAEALAILSRLSAIDSSTYRDERLAHDRRVFDVYAPDLMGVVLLRLGRRAEAGKSFAKAAAAAPDELSYRIKAEAFRSRPQPEASASRP